MTLSTVKALVSLYEILNGVAQKSSDNGKDVCILTVIGTGVDENNFNDIKETTLQGGLKSREDYA